MKALSIRQPWAWLICSGYKGIENRGWSTKFRGRIYVHAGLQFDFNAGLVPSINWDDGSLQPVHEAYHLLPSDAKDALMLLALSWKNQSALIGEVDIVDCVTESDSPWFLSGKYGFVLANPVLYKQPVPYRGRLRFFEVSK